VGYGGSRNWEGTPKEESMLDAQHTQNLGEDEAGSLWGFHLPQTISAAVLLPGTSCPVSMVDGLSASVLHPPSFWYN
jgi:hypothetical protein